ncbi:MAG TPA: PIN domain-containing protein [archaeon]|nr:PIN domain-containing protein [archaeon]
MTVSRLLLDSSAWLNYLSIEGGKMKPIVESEATAIFTSVISLHEVHKVLSKAGKTREELENAIGFIEENSAVLPIYRNTALDASSISLTHGLHTVDSIIYAAAQESGCELVTFDKHFRGMPSVRLIKA